MYRTLVLSAVALAFLVIVVGAYVRLEDAGLGCPDWPGCYGQMLGVPDEPHEVARAQRGVSRQDGGRRARVEGNVPSLSRRHAGPPDTRDRRDRRGACGSGSAVRPGSPPALVALVALQATLGMWTVTMLLKPAIVTLHLLGGMATLALILWLALREIDPPAPPAAAAARLRPWAAAGLAVLVCQIALGGWVSANYAALACLDFPACHGQWVPDMDFANAFHVRARARHDRGRRSARAGGADRHPLDASRRRARHGRPASAGSALAALRVPALRAHGGGAARCCSRCRPRSASRTCCAGCRSCWRSRTTPAPRFCWRCSWC